MLSLFIVSMHSPVLFMFPFQVVGCSSQMEPAALDVCLQFLIGAGICPTHLVTDRSTTIRTLLKTKYPEILHQFDPWHWIKVRRLELEYTLWSLCGHSLVILWSFSVHFLVIFWSLCVHFLVILWSFSGHSEVI